jgi:hypothetical protein
MGLLGSSCAATPFSAEAVSELASRATTIVSTSPLVGSFSLAMVWVVRDGLRKRARRLQHKQQREAREDHKSQLRVSADCFYASVFNNAHAVASTARGESIPVPQSWPQSLEQVLQTAVPQSSHHSAAFVILFVMLTLVVRTFEQVVEQDERGEDRPSNM